MDIVDDDIFYDVDGDLMDIADIINPERTYNLRVRIDHFNYLNDTEFFNRFRLSKPTVTLIFNQIEEFLKIEQNEKKESDAYTPSKQNCQCNKNGCKCGANENTSNEYSNLLSDQESVERDSVGKRRCNCGKNSNCKCGTAIESSVFDDNTMETKDLENTVKRSVNEYESDESKLRYIKRNVIGYIDPVAYVPNEENEENGEYDEYDTDSIGRLKRDAKPNRLKSFENGEYFLDLHPQMYRLSPVNNVEAFRGGGKKGYKRRRQAPFIRTRRGVLVDREEPRQLTDMSEEEIFGALPQSYEGELARFKRVKRSKTEK